MSREGFKNGDRVIVVAPIELFGGDGRVGTIQGNYLEVDGDCENPEGRWWLNEEDFGRIHKLRDHETTFESLFEAIVDAKKSVESAENELVMAEQAFDGYFKNRLRAETEGL